MSEQFSLLYQAALAAPYVAGSGEITVTAPVRGVAPTEGTFSLSIADSSTGNIIVVFRVASVSGTTFSGAAEGPDASAPSASPVYGTMLTPEAMEQIEADTEAAAVATAVALALSEAFYQTVEDTGSPVTQRRVMNFVGSGVSIADLGGVTTVTIPGGGGGGGDISIGEFADLPAEVDGNLFQQTDGPYTFIGTDGEWNAFAFSLPAVLPIDADFTWDNQALATTDSTHGYVDMNVPEGTGGSLSISLRTQAQPSTPYTLDAVMQLSNVATAGGIDWGVGFRDSVSGKILQIMAQFEGGACTFTVLKWNTSTSFNGTAATGITAAFTVLGPVYFRLTNDGTTLSLFAGNGLTWSLLFSDTVGDFITPTDICWGLLSTGTGTSAAADANLVSWNPAA